MISKSCTLQFVNHVVGMPTSKDTAPMKNTFGGKGSMTCRQIFWIKCNSKAITFKRCQNMGDCGSNSGSLILKTNLGSRTQLKLDGFSILLKHCTLLILSSFFSRGKTRLTPLLWLQYRSRPSKSLHG